MKEDRFALRCDPEVLQKAKEYARAQGVPLSQLVDQFLRQLAKAHDDRPKTDEELGVEQA
jgi:predicted HicB family RNase H-like nuclease